MVIHVLALVADNYTTFTLADITIPFLLTSIHTALVHTSCPSRRVDNPGVQRSISTHHLGRYLGTGQFDGTSPHAQREGIRPQR